MTENKGDLISREALKQALSEPLYRSTIKDFGEVIEYTHIMNTIDNAPTVERPQGKWIGDILNLDVRCSNCNSYALERGDYPELSKYCPACGAEMEILS